MDESARSLSSFVHKSDIQQFGTTYTAMKPSSNSDVSRHYDEMLRLPIERDPRRELKENNAMLKEHNSVVVVVSSIDDDNDRVRKIGVNTGNLR